MAIQHLGSKLRARRIARALRRSGAFVPRRRLPVIYIPGIFGSRLHDRDSGVDVWGSPRALLWPRAGEAGFGIDPADPQRLLASEVLHEFDVVPGLSSSLVTRDVVNVLQAALGYRMGRDLFFLGYDWRQDLRQLGPRLEGEIRRIEHLFGAQQRVVLLVQSSANLAVRHWLRSASAAPLRDRIAQWVAFGPPWLGTWDTAYMLHHGYWPAGKRAHGFSAEIIGSCPATWQLLPATGRLIGADGRDVPGFDIFDPACWQASRLLPAFLRDATDGAARLAQHLADARAFSHSVQGACPHEQAVPQTWVVGEANRALTAAIDGDRGLALDRAAIERDYPQWACRALVVGDDHIPLAHYSSAPCGALVQMAQAAPWGENHVLITRARDHRALINHDPNLLALARNLAALHERMIENP